MDKKIKRLGVKIFKTVISLMLILSIAGVAIKTNEAQAGYRNPEGEKGLIGVSAKETTNNYKKTFHITYPDLKIENGKIELTYDISYNNSKENWDESCKLFFILPKGVNFKNFSFISKEKEEKTLIAETANSWLLNTDNELHTKTGVGNWEKAKKNVLTAGDKKLTDYFEGILKKGNADKIFVMKNSTQLSQKGKILLTVTINEEKIANNLLFYIGITDGIWNRGAGYTKSITKQDITALKEKEEQKIKKQQEEYNRKKELEEKTKKEKLKKEINHKKTNLKNKTVIIKKKIKKLKINKQKNTD